MSVEYLNNKAFEKLVLRYNEFKNEDKNGKEFKEVQNELAKAFYLLADNIIRAFNFKLDKDDSMQECVLTCFEKIDKFNPERGKLFNYSTTIIIHLCFALHRKVKNYNELKCKYKNYLEVTQENKITLRNNKKKNNEKDKEGRK